LNDAMLFGVSQQLYCLSSMVVVFIRRRASAWQGEKGSAR
jgi:hypothetical protein